MTKKSQIDDKVPAPPLGRRAMQAEQTRHDILAAARRRFATQGYAATSLKDVATDAGVSVQTLYDSIGSKADLVRRLNDLVDIEANVGEIAATVGTEQDPRVIARIPPASRGGSSNVATTSCGPRSPAPRPSPSSPWSSTKAVAGIEQGRRASQVGLAGLGALRPGLNVDDAATTIAALADYRMALVLVDDHHLTLDELEDWIADVTARAVLA